VNNKRVDVAVVTGGGHGIGRALCRRLAADGVKVVVADIEAEAARTIAAEINGVAQEVDVCDESAIVRLVEDVEAEIGPIDAFISNAGVAFGDGESGSISKEGGLNPIDDRWVTSWNVNVMAQVYKHASVGFSESLAINYGDDGITVSVVCPQAVATRLIGMEDDSDATEGGFGGNEVDGILKAEDVADIIIDQALEGRFMILTHPQVATYIQRKSGDYDRWIGGMRKFRRSLAK